MSKDGRFQPNDTTFKMIADIAPVMIWQADSLGHCVWFNETWVNFRGRNADAELGEGWLEGIHPEDSQRFLYIFRSSYATKANFETVFRLKRKDTIYRWIKIKGVPFFEGDSFLGFVASCFDITDSKISHDKLQNGEIKLRKLLDEAMVGFAEIDMRGAISYANPCYCKMLGFSQVEILGKNIKELIHIDDIERLSPEQKSLQEAKLKLIEMEIRYLHKGGSVIHAIIKISGIRNESGILTGFNSQSIDVTRRFELERNVQATNNRFEMALRSGKMGVWEWDLVTNSMLWDDTHYALYGLDKATATVGWPSWENYLHPRDRSCLEEELENALDGKDNIIYNYRIIRPDQSIRHIRANAILERDEEKNPMRLIGISWDVTEEIQKEEELEKRRDLSSFSSRLMALADMAKVVSHDLADPVLKISNCAKSMDPFLDSIGDQEVRDQIKQFSKAVLQQAQNISTTIESLQQIASGSDGNSFKFFKLTDLVNDCLKFMHSQLMEYKIEVRTNLKSFGDLKVYCNSRQITHVLLNLVTNSFEATKALSERWISITAERQNGIVAIKIVDSGTILPEMNNGLGLKVVKSLVENNQGQIYFDPSSLNTTFVVELPLEIHKKSQAAA